MVSEKVIFLSGCDQQLDPGRVSAVLIQKASKFVSDIRIEVAGRRANAKSLLGVMSLSMDKDTEVEVIAKGPDEDEALEVISAYLQNPAAE